jgi:protein arginine kinase
MSGSADGASSDRFRLYGLMPAWFDNRGPESGMVVSTRIRLARNLSEYRFPPHASSKEKQAIFKDVTSVFSAPLFSDFVIVNFGRLPKIEQHFLAEERRVSMDMLRGEGERGVVCDLPGRFSVMINEEDHLRIQGMDSGFHTTRLWKAVNQFDDAIGKGVKYAYSGRLGYLTACPTNSGTGLRVSYLMHLPGLVLTKAIDPVLQGASQMGISTRGFFGENSDVVGNFFQLSNQATMGASETEFIESTSKTIQEIISHERGARERLLKDAKSEVSDKVWRAHGILSNARMLSVTELLSLTSAIRLGIDCEIYNELTIDDINKLIMISMPAHLQVYMTDKGGYEELDEARADVARQAFTSGEKKEPVENKAVEDKAIEKKVTKQKVVENKAVKKKAVKKKVRKPVSDISA